MRFDFAYGKDEKVKIFFRFCEKPKAGPPLELPAAQGEVKVWIYINRQWSGPFALGMPAQRREVATNPMELVTVAQFLIRDAIYDRWHKLRDIEKELRQKAGPFFTAEQMMERFYQLYPIQSDAEAAPVASANSNRIGS
ncbi:hypothetical protein IC229_26210 [Spirosoma sp. BT702]|uniref:Uncharacterized protein n=1 Tax=Spirosoma profusum TaxID=2771354 RepID=A0A926Y541_9BACT|nr:hypothetical protein [Spirosoma profusum]MBD2704165.1 hypothetical protein [Spirosoma profusum]